MNAKGTAVALLGLSLLVAHYKTNPDGATLRGAITDVNGGPKQADAHAAFLRMFGLLGAIALATIASTASDGAGTFFVGFFLLLWVIWGMKNINTLKTATVSNYFQVKPKA